MSPRLSAFVLLAGVLAAQAGCRSRCDQRPGLFSSRAHADAPCQTVGRNTGCFDAAIGQPTPCPPGATVAPGGGPYPYLPMGAVPGGTGPRPDELHMPNELIPRPAVPIPAPGDASLPFPTSPGVPVKAGPNK